MICKTIDIWDGYKYSGEMEDGFKPKLTTYIRSGQQERGIVLVLPGGGYTGTSERESEAIALTMNQAGFHACVLDYSVAPRTYPCALLDVAKSLTLIKDFPQTWNINLEKLYIIGFSAGGHLAATISNKYKEAWLNEYQGIDIKGLRIEGTILSYPVLISGQYRHKGSFSNLLGDNDTPKNRDLHSMDLLVNENTPRTFLWHTLEDTSVPMENSMAYAKALRAKNIPFEMHIYPYGVHGLSLCTKDTAVKDNQIQPHAAGWIDLCLKWMKL